MEFYSYLVEHDYGLAPNPFGQYCTLTVCKPLIRSSSVLNVGDWIIGTGSKALEDTTGKTLRGYLIYAMKVSEIIPLDRYWHDSRFQYKKPIINGPLVSIYGDNIYHLDENSDWVQADSAHSNSDGTPNQKHLETDTSGVNSLISTEFYYFGDNAPQIPKRLKGVCHSGIGQKKLSEDQGLELIGWIESNFKQGINGDPLNWIEHNQLNLF